MLEQIPEWTLGLGVVALVVAMVHAGSAVARRRLARGVQGETPGEGVGAVVGAMLGLLAFMLAFAFGMAADRRDSRKQLLLDEVNSIGTTFLRTDLIPDSQRSAARNLLRKYVDLRLEAADYPEKLQECQQEADNVQSLLWAQAAKLRDAELKNPDVTALYVDSLNEMIDMQTSRMTVSSYRIPTTVWMVFGLLLVLSTLGVGYNFGLQSSGPHGLLTMMMSVSLAAVMFLIFDLDRGNAGWLKVDQEPMYNLREQMGSS